MCIGRFHLMSRLGSLKLKKCLRVYVMTLSGTHPIRAYYTYNSVLVFQKEKYIIFYFKNNIVFIICSIVSFTTVMHNNISTDWTNN